MKYFTLKFVKEAPGANTLTFFCGIYEEVENASLKIVEHFLGKIHYQILQSWNMDQLRQNKLT
jgi:hypothetical protein